MNNESNRQDLLREYWIGSATTLFGRIIGLVGDKAIADEILQQVAMVAIERLDTDSVQNQDDFLRWTWARAKWFSLDWFVEKGKWVEAEDMVGSESPESELAQRQLWNMLIDSLPKQQALITRLKVQGYRLTEIANKLGVSDSSVRSNWRFAKNTLVGKIEEYYYEK